MERTFSILLTGKSGIMCSSSQSLTGIPTVRWPAIKMNCIIFLLI